MRIYDQIDMQGKLTYYVYDSDGNEIHQWSSNNHIVLGGRQMVAKMFLGESIPGISHLAVGTGNREVDEKADQTLDNELLRKPIRLLDLAKDITTLNGGEKEPDKIKVTISTEFDFHEANDGLTEAALFNQPNGGIMYNRIVFPVINKTKDFKLSLVWEVIF